jgi:putative lipase involved disintegration of autophagic bodies
MNEIRSPRRPRVKAPPDLAPAGTPLHIAVAPGLLDHEHVVIHEDDDTDETYQSRCDMVAALLDYARKG